MSPLKSILLGIVSGLVAIFTLFSKDKYPDANKLIKKADGLSQEAKKAALRDYVK